MSRLTSSAGPRLETLFALFPPADDMPEYKIVPADKVPPPYHDLLVHDQHMTVTVERHHGELVDVRILARRHKDDDYARKILLATHDTARVVQFGIVRVNLDCCSAAVRAAIVAGQMPFGRILIEHNVLRRIEPTAYLHVTPSEAMCAWFGLKKPVPTYGRLAIIHCDDKPAVELLEIVKPE